MHQSVGALYNNFSHPIEQVSNGRYGVTQVRHLLAVGGTQNLLIKSIIFSMTRSFPQYMDGPSSVMKRRMSWCMRSWSPDMIVHDLLNFAGCYILVGRNKEAM